MKIFRDNALTILALFSFTSSGWAQVSIDSLGTAYAENFDGMGSSATATVPSGFKIGVDWSTGTTATTLAFGSTGAGAVTGTSSGGVINWANGVTASASDRSLGFLNTGTFTSPRSIVFAFVNNTGSTITDLTITFDYEQTRSGTRQFDWTFFHGSSPSPSTAAPSGDQSYPAEANNTTIFNPPASTSKSVTLSGLSIAPGVTYYIRWTFTGLAGSSNGKGIGIDNFNLTASNSSCTPPATQTVSGTTTICSGASAIVNLNGSETGVTYYLKNGSTIVNTAAGTGSGISFASVSPVATTTYTVVATNDTTFCGATMSGSAIVTVDSAVTPSVTVTANPGTTTCTDNQVIFTATPVNGGLSPTYLWKTNGVEDPSPNGSATYTNSALANGETIDCELTSSLSCVTSSTADAPQLTMVITGSVTPSVSVSASPATTICAGTTVIFTATPVNGGSSPTYLWKTNGVEDPAPNGSATYTNSSLAHEDTIDCQLISNDPCASPATADATQISMIVNATFTPSVSVTADPGSTICSNSPVTFTATPVNGGASPNYQWKTNGTSVTGAASATFVTSNLGNGDVVTVVMTPSSEICVSPASATSGGITMTVNPIPGSTITAAASVVQNSTGNTASVPEAGVGASYVWTISNGTITAGDGTAAISYTAGNTPGTLTLGCTVTTSAGCNSVGGTNVSVQAPVLAGWDVSTQPGGPGNFGVSPLPASSSDGNLTVGGLTRGSGVATPSGSTGAARGWGGADWQSASAAAAITANKFATFTVAAQPGFKVSYNAISRFNYRRSGTGPGSGMIQYQVGSEDSFHDITPVSYPSTSSSGGTLNPIDLSGIPALQDVPAITVVTFRIVNFGGTSVNGTWYVFDPATNASPDLEVAGYVTCVPPTATLAGDAAICAGDSADLTTTLSGVPPWSVTWSDGVISNNVASSPLVRTVSPGSTAIYTLTSVSDSGSCGAGTVSGSATITVNPLPTVTIEPATTNAECGSTVVLTASPAGDGPLTYQWYDTQTNAIAGETNLTLTLTNVHGVQTGNYTILVAGPFCTASAVANVAVADTVVPIITLLGANPATNECHAAYTDAGATATDTCSGNVEVTTNSTVDANVPGIYTITYTADDGNGNTNTVTRTVYVEDTTAPLITYYFTNLTLNADGSCQALMPNVAITNYLVAEDGCSETITVTQSPTNNAVLALGTNEVILMVADAAGNTVYSTNTVVVIDVTGPLVTVIGDNPLTLECHAVFVDPGASANDNCSDAMLMTTNGVVNPNVPGSYTIEYSATDSAGNSTTNTRMVNVLDTAAPVLTLLGDNPATNECHAVYVDAGATASDACAGPVAVSTNSTVDANVPGVYTIIYTSHDGNGNTNTVTRTVFVEDTTAPLITYNFTNLTLSADSNCQALMPDVTVTNYILVEEGCSSAVTITQSPTNNAVLALGTNEVLLTVADTAGNTAYSTNTIVVVDTTGPVVAVNGDNPLALECHATFVDPGASATDNCSIVVAVITNNLVDPNVPGSYAIEYSATDSAGNSTTNTRIVNVVDTIAPTLTILGDNPATNECQAVYTDAGATASDACAGPVGVSTNNLVNANVPGVYMVTYTSDDGNGNTNTATRTVYVVDTLPPTLTVLGANPATNECHAPYVDAGATANDACAGVVGVSTNSAVDANVPGIYTVIYTSDDGNGHTNTATRTVQVVDTLPPVIVCAPNKTVECGSPWTFDEPSAEDGCAGTNVTLVVLETVTNANVFMRTWAASDPAGNTNTCSQSVAVADSVGVVILLLGPNPATNECHAAYTDTGVTASVCDGEVTVSTNSTVDPNLPGIYSVTYTADDGDGHTNTATRTVYVVDTTAPVITYYFTNLTFSADGSCQAPMPDVTGTNYILAEDVCGEITITQIPTNNALLNPGTNEVVLTVVDSASNISYSTNTIIIVDTTPPAITLIGANPLTVECHGAFADPGANASDNCSGIVAVMTNGIVNVDVPGSYTIEYTADDAAGNSATNVRIVNVIDAIAPVITLNGADPLVVECHSGFIDPGAIAADACSGPVGVVLSGSVDANTPGSYTLIYTADDGNGNTNSITRTVNVVDTVGPMIVILGPNPATNECHVAYADSGATANDVCTGNAILSTNSTVDVDVPGVYVVTYTSEDGNGHTNTATRTVYVEDTIAPVIVCTPNKMVECGSPWSFDEPVAEDGCAGTNVILVVLETTTNGLTFTRTWAASDPAGNTNTCSQSVTVADTAAPIITLLGANPATNECHAAYTDAGATASDACAGDVNVSTNSTVDVNVPGVYSVTYSTDDGAGNTNIATRTVYVEDTTAPLITYYFTNLTLSANSNCQALMPDVTGTNYILAEDTCGAVTIAQTPMNNAVLNPGTNEVILVVTDSVGNTTYSTNTIVVVDTLPPVIGECLTNRTLIVGNSCLITLPDFTGELTVNDACGAVTVSQNPSPGTEVGVGQLLIALTASDAANNSSVCMFSLNVTAPPGANTNISISEFMAKNTITITDDFGTYSDWIEIHNAGSCPVNLNGWSLTDSAASLTKWQFPATNIGPGQFLVVWASDQNRRMPGSPLHTNFKLSDEGEYLALVQPDGVSVATHFSPAFPPQLTDVSYGLPTDRPTNTFLALATPGSANSVATNFVPGTTNVIISEFMAKNTIGPVDDFGDHSDWIEIYNGGCCPVNLNNWSLTDNAGSLTKWRFPATNIGPGEFLVVWASDRNRRTPGSPLHTNFKMSDEGEYLALVQPDGVTIATQFAPAFPPQFPDVSYGLPSNNVANNYLAWPTPGLANSPETNFMVAELNVTPERGWYVNPVSVSVETPTTGATIYFTTNGSLPSPTNGFAYSSPLVFSNTTVFRAAAYRPGFLPSIVTHTYIFPSQVAYQTGSGFPTNWGFAMVGTSLQAVPTYYTCNSNLVNDPRWGDRMSEALLSLPSLSVVMNPDDMFGTNGIYANTFGSGDAWERACSVEYMRPDSEPGFQIDCGIRIHGQITRDPTVTPKHNLRLHFKQIYGAPKLQFDLYPGSPVQDFDVLVLHASFTDHWYLLGPTAQLQRNRWYADTQEETGGYGTHGVYVNLYINGLYWGMYNLGERPDASYAANYLGGNKSDYDAFNGTELMDGTTNAWYELLNLVQAGITNDVAWSNACHYLNVPHFIDYLLINFYGVTLEVFDHNWWLAGSVTRGVPFRFFSWDAEDGFEAFGPEVSAAYDMTQLAENCPSWICELHSALSQSPQYRQMFGDHAQRLLFNNGALTPERSVARWMKRAREIDSAMISETVRWGITNWWGVSISYPTWMLFTHDDWLAEQNYLMTNWFPQRTDILVGHLRNAGLYPALNAPVFSPHGGLIVESLPVTITTPPDSILCYTTNGTDPRLPDGNLSPDAFIYDQGPTLILTLTNNTVLSARAFTSNTWSALVEASYSLASEVELSIGNITRRSDGAIKLDFQAAPGLSYTLRACTNLQTAAINFSDWETIGSVVPFPDGTFTFVDTTATNHPVRFYRLTWP